MKTFISKTAFTEGCLMVNKTHSDNALMKFAAKFGEPHSVAANKPVLINSSEEIWFIEHGSVDILSAEYAGDQAQTALEHVARLETGRLIIGVEGEANGIKLLAKGVQGTILRSLSRDLLLDRLSEEQWLQTLACQVIDEVDAWITDISLALARDIESRPPAEHLISPGSMPCTGVVSSQQGVVWVVGDDLDFSYLGLTDHLLATDCPKTVPLTQDSWAHLYQVGDETCKSTSDFDISTLLTEVLPEFQRLALDAVFLHRRLLLADDANLQMAQARLRRHQKARAIAKLAMLTTEPVHGKAIESPLEAAVRMVGKYEGIEICSPAYSTGTEPTLSDYLESSAIRTREINLSSETRWWLGNSGAMLGFRSDNDEPVVLLPSTFGRYRLVDPVSGKSSRANESTADEIHQVQMLCPALQSESAVDLDKLISIGNVKITADLFRLAAAGLGAGLVALTPAVVVNILVGRIIPENDAGTLLQLAAILTVLGLIAASLHVLRGTALMQLEGRISARLGAALTDRLLRLRGGFFRRYNAGELAAKSLVFQEIRDQVSGVAANSVLSTLFVMPAFGLMFFYDFALALTALVLGIIAIAVVALFCILHIEPQRRYLDSTLKMFGEVHQYLNGITKLRLAGAEDSVYAAWANRYSEHKNAEMQLSALSEHLIAFCASVPAIASAILFSVLVLNGNRALATEDFLAAYTAAMVFYMSIFMLGQSARAIALVKPACEQVLPILSNAASSGSRGGTGLRLKGEIFLNRVSFAYPDHQSSVLHQVSIHAKPGEFIAIVGESGSGKSTLFRLALGLETPSSGAVYYDGRDLSCLDSATVRKQVGVVTQDGDLQNGTVLENIIGVGANLTIEDAWRATRKAAIEDDIRAMPMELYTAVGTNSSTFSGGQIQRIRIAAALARNPGIIFLDEPTSWLDTKSQALTMQSINDSTITRFVIAHRLSTIRKADRIYVLQAGRVIQVGGFEELLETDGFFRDMALRQIA